MGNFALYMEQQLCNTSSNVGEARAGFEVRHKSSKRTKISVFEEIPKNRKNVTTQCYKLESLPNHSNFHFITQKHLNFVKLMVKRWIKPCR